MQRIFSENNELLHIIYRKKDILSERDNITRDFDLLQVASMKLPIKQFRAHKHLPTKKETIGTQEAWVVINGKVKVLYYDNKDNKIYSTILSDGDCTITISGGHTYEILEDNTLIYEFKTGPYLGQEKDKEFINVNV